MGWQWHHLDHMQIICTHSRQITIPAPYHSIFYRPDALPDTQPTVSKRLRQTLYWEITTLRITILSVVYLWTLVLELTECQLYKLRNRYKPQNNHLNRRILVKMHSITIQPPAVYRNHVLSAERSPFRMNLICNTIMNFNRCAHQLHSNACMFCT